MKGHLKYKAFLVALFVFGCVLPFVDGLVFIEVSFLIIPTILFFFITLIVLIVSLFSGKKKFMGESLMFFLPVVVFIFSQLASTFLIDKLSLYRSENMIAKVENFKVINGLYPEGLTTISGFHLGIKYEFIDKEHFQLEYSRGFAVREVYSSGNQEWISYGWND
jgi:hypothetical protein